MAGDDVGFEPFLPQWEVIKGFKAWANMIQFVFHFEKVSPVVVYSTNKYYYFCFFLAVLFGMRDLNSLTRDQTCTPCTGSAEFNHWTTRKSPQIIIVHLLHSSHCSGFKGFPGGSAVKNPPANMGDMGLIPESGRSNGAGNGSPPQYSCMENPMDRGAWWATVHGVAKYRT